MRKHRLVVVILLPVFASACMSLQRQGMTTYDQYTDQAGSRMFKYMAMSNVFYPTNSIDAEETRMEQLQVWLDDNKYCQTGYQIIEKRIVSRGSGEDAMNITYIGKCD